MTRAELAERRSQNRKARAAKAGEPPPPERPPLPVPPPGRPSKFTAERIGKILTYAKMAPANVKAIAEASGISESALLDWVSRGVKAGPDHPDPIESAYYDFACQFKEARASAEIMAEYRILSAGKDPKHWTANAWWLERRNPQLFAKPTRLELSGPDGAPIQITDEDRVNRLKTLLTAVISGGATLESLGLPAMKQVGAATTAEQEA